MTAITFTNSKNQQRCEFVPLNPGNVRLYVCGPTVYDRAHLGNARPVVVFDVLYRLLKHVYGHECVTYARNITDIDDKIIERAAALEISIDRLTTMTTEWFHQDMAALGVDYRDDPNFFEPRATDFVADMLSMIEQLVAKGHAYVAEGHVLFSVKSYSDYGALSGRTVDEMIAGARVEIAPYKRNPMDFVLWKPSTEEQPGWDSSWGRGRPGWHIECSAMSYAFFGDSFDIHGGGGDLMFPHHENEIAQSQCCHPNGEFARYWLHNEMLRVDGKKMSKSLGNFFTVRDLLNQGISGDEIRLVFMSTHYRKPMNWTEEKLEQAKVTVNKWRELTAGVESSGTPETVLDALKQDLNSSLAITELHQLAAKGDIEALKGGANFLGLFQTPDQKQKTADAAIPISAINRIESLIKQRTAARSISDYRLADAIRDNLASIGITLTDDVVESTWSYDPDHPNFGRWELLD
ncbi:MAG: cysteine--tRNA ligase [Aestuariivita sp.]|nr:cysteine--tRNA ligase [Aestuariivita sp.]MCY4347538.1 cysteine--tRNA ligase [Aestuariivita sp.]